ncbi:12-oxophytodienoate reductase [Noviherbaspirillum saxi]|uniref:12-oxophytodienoate reductase n=1 Tax=Noviherbaspirillum saxi TaxID=2320863 RepID=A0A3A3FEB5_9BURK|nr:12-oxophytodienoate reductase [Noviherbaspirillum saxi]RJF91686.1 12-oxophytodienoate reductase [Noviherbaspirillum saxi]
MTEYHAPLLQSLSIRSTRLRSRIVMSPMTRGFSPDGVPGSDVADYYRRRAENGVGLIVTEAVGIDHPAAVGSAGFDEHDVPHMFGAKALDGWKRVVADVHAAGGAIFPQLWHQGVMREPDTGPCPAAPSCRPSGDWGPTGRPTSLRPDYISRMAPATQAMTESDIQEVIDAFGRSAAHARECGFDGIAILGAHGYLIDSFLWAETNRRSDRWGGGLKERTRFAVEVVKSIRRAAGEDMPILFRFSQWKQQDFSARLVNTPQELEQMLGPIADAGIDVFDASTRFFAKSAFEGSDMTLAGWAKKVTGRMSMAVGGIGMQADGRDPAANAKPDNLDRVLEHIRREEFDLVGLGRPLIADPGWLGKLLSGSPANPYTQSLLDKLC